MSFEESEGWSRKTERDGVGDEAVIGEPDKDLVAVQSYRPKAANKEVMVDFGGPPRGFRG